MVASSFRQADGWFAEEKDMLSARVTKLQEHNRQLRTDINKLNQTPNKAQVTAVGGSSNHDLVFSAALNLVSRGTAWISAPNRLSH